jgi:prohibitin 2
MSQTQREAWERLQLMLQKRKAGFGGMPSGGGRGGMGLVGTLVLAGIGTWAASNALFNGILSLLSEGASF